MPKITINITTFRRPHLLKKAINSVLRQTYTDFQVCIYDNASNDETKEIVESFCRQDSRVKYFCHFENIGMMKNYAFAFSKINTPFFSFLSDDDVLLPDFCEVLLKGFDQHSDIAFSACGLVVMNDKNEMGRDPIFFWPREGYYSSAQGVLEMIGKFPIPTGILFNNEKIKHIKPDFSAETQILWDPDFLLQIAVEYPFFITKKKCGVYFTHSNAFSSGFFGAMEEEKLQNYFQALKNVSTRLLENPHLHSSNLFEVETAFKNMARGNLNSCINKLISKNKFKAASFFIKALCLNYGINSTTAFLYLNSLVLRVFPFFKPLLYHLPIEILRALNKRKKKNVLKENDIREQVNEYLISLDT